MLTTVASRFRLQTNLKSAASCSAVVEPRNAGTEMLNKEMAPTNVLAAISLLVVTKLAGNEAHQQQSLKLMTRPSDGAALCAIDPPTVNATMSQRMPGAPETVRCGMTCSSDEGCKHFNYVSTESNPCQLYHDRPRHFDVVPHCQHYYQPGQQQLKLTVAVCYTESKKN